MTVETGAPTIERALLALSSFDADRASIPNGVGFNQRDTGFGNSLAQQIRSGRTLTERQAFAAHRMLATYREQLATLGIDYAAIAPPAPPQPKTTERVVDAEGEWFIVRFPYDQALVTAIKMLPDRPKWDADKRVWSAKNTDDNIVAVAQFVRRYGFTTTEAATKMLMQADALMEAQEAYARELIEQSNAAAAELEIEGLGGVLRPFQKAGVKYAMAQRRTYIADEMGLGKTVQGIATVHALQAYPAIVVCPASLKENWRREWLKWAPGKRVTIVKGRAKHENVDANLLFGGTGLMGDVIIVNYDVLDSWVPTLQARAPRALILDESHYVKTQGAKRTKACRDLAKGIGVCLLLTGTPVLNRPAELMTQLAVMDRLRELGGASEFRRRYIDPWEPNLHELNDRLRSLCYIRRTKAQVLTELPPKIRAVVPIELDNMAEYLEAEGELVAFLIREDPEKARVARLAEDLAHIEALKQLVAKGKMAGAIEWIEDFLESGEKLILFAWHRSIVDQLAERFNAPAIYGGTPMLERDRIVQKFQEDDATRLIVGNMQAMGVGLTLTAASNVAFLELGWTPAVHDQAEDRAHRIGQLDSVTAHYLLAPLTIDERIQRLIDAKRVVVNATTEGRVQMEEQSVLSDLIADLTGRRSE